ncbi:unnamed protein product, partial [Didymodactylos carnosus]
MRCWCGKGNDTSVKTVGVCVRKDRVSPASSTGVLLNNAGFDYNVTRDRQSAIIMFCHQLNLSVMINANNPDDVLSGQNVTLDSRDIYLFSPYLVTNGRFSSLTDWQQKAVKCFNKTIELGIKVACQAT